MNPEQTQAWLDNQRRQTLALESIAECLRVIAGSQQKGPRYTRPLDKFKNFDWSTIAATVTKHDYQGAAVVSCNGQMYTRKSRPDFGDDVWFSRSLGKGPDGKSEYDVLIKFAAPPKVKSLSQDVVEALG